jgi:hypothetical protein
MRVRAWKAGATALAAVTVAAAWVATPAFADPSGGTTTTFEITAGTLDITVQSDADLGTGVTTEAISGQLGEVAVTDSRSAADASWLAGAHSSDFTTGAGGANRTVAADLIDYWSGPATAGPVGSGTFTPGEATDADAVPFDADNTTNIDAFTHDGGTGNNSVSWNPTVIVNPPDDIVIGIYTGTVTHSVA